jgi:hypothetical protein
MVFLRCTSTIQPVRPLESTAEAQPQFQPALLRLSVALLIGLHWLCSRNLSRLRAPGTLSFDEYSANTLPISWVLVRLLACSTNLPSFVGKSPLNRVATPLGFEPRITPPKGAVLPLHHGVRGLAILDWRFSIQAQCPKFSATALPRSNSPRKLRLNDR